MKGWRSAVTRDCYDQLSLGAGRLRAKAQRMSDRLDAGLRTLAAHNNLVARWQETLAELDEVTKAMKALEAVR